MKANGWSSPTWSCSSVSSSVTTSSPTTFTCARSSPAATWLLTPTCRARDHPATSPPMNQNAKSRTRAAVSRWRHVGRHLLLVLWSVMSHWHSNTQVTVWLERVTWDYGLLDRIPVCQSRWRSITTPVLILMR